MDDDQVTHTLNNLVTMEHYDLDPEVSDRLSVNSFFLSRTLSIKNYFKFL